MNTAYKSAFDSGQYQDAYAQMLATYNLVESAYAARGADMPDLPIGEPHELCLLLQSMLHRLQREV